jgi:hypothetical protein
VFTRFIEAVDLKVKITEIGFDIRKVRTMLRYLKVITGGSVFNQSPIYVITALLQIREIYQSIAEIQCEKSRARYDGHIIPILIAFKRPRAIMARTLLGVTFNRFAASAVLMSFTVQSIPLKRKNSTMQGNPNTSENASARVDAEAWEIAFKPYTYTEACSLFR